MEKVTPCRSAMDILARWGHHEQLSTSEVVKLAGRTHPTVYKWMIGLLVRGYFRRDKARNPPLWTITPRGREAITEAGRAELAGRRP